MEKREGDVASRTETLPQQRTILLVDDHPSIRLILANGLRANGWHILLAANGTDALHLCRTYGGQIDLLISDVGLVPEEVARRGGDVKGVANGLELVRELVALRPSLRTLLISGYSDERLQRLGAYQYGCQILRKPFDLKTLLARAAEAVTFPSSSLS